MITPATELAMLHMAVTEALAALSGKTDLDLLDAFSTLVIEHGGTYVIPQGTNPASHMIEVSLHGVFALGGSELAAVRNWKQAANRCLEAAKAAA